MGSRFPPHAWPSQPVETASKFERVVIAGKDPILGFEGYRVEEGRGDRGEGDTRGGGGGAENARRTTIAHLFLSLYIYATC